MSGRLPRWPCTSRLLTEDVQVESTRLCQGARYPTFANYAKVGHPPVKMIRPDDFISDYVPDGALKPLGDPAL